MERPKRPLSAYNLFFQDERVRMLATRPVRPKGAPLCQGHGKIGFAEMAKTIAAQWNAIAPDVKRKYKAMARGEKIRYKQREAHWKKHVAALSSVPTSVTTKFPKSRRPRTTTKSAATAK
ncbi:hypothetical protein ACA910_001492 [Epithemia clementina (nom. ined.)]